MRKNNVTQYLLIIASVILTLVSQAGIDPNPLVISIVCDTFNVLRSVPVNFVANISGGTPPCTIKWEFGDGAVVWNQTNVSHAYDTPGTYTVWLRVWDSASRYQYTSVVIIVRYASTNIPTVNNLTDIGNFDIDVMETSTPDMVYVAWQGIYNDTYEYYCLARYKRDTPSYPDSIATVQGESALSQACDEPDNPEEAADYCWNNASVNEGNAGCGAVSIWDEGKGPVFNGLPPTLSFSYEDEAMYDGNYDSICGDTAEDNSLPLDCIYYPDETVIVSVVCGYDDWDELFPDIFINRGPTKMDQTNGVAVSFDPGYLWPNLFNVGVLTLRPQFNPSIPTGYSVYWAYTRWDTKRAYLNRILPPSGTDMLVHNTDEVDRHYLVPATDSNGFVWTVWKRINAGLPQHVFARAFDPVTATFGATIQVNGDVRPLDGGYVTMAVAGDRNQHVWVIWYSSGKIWGRIISSLSLGNATVFPAITTPPIKITDETPNSFEEIHAVSDTDSLVWLGFKDNTPDLRLKFFN